MRQAVSSNRNPYLSNAISHQHTHTCVTYNESFPSKRFKADLQLQLPASDDFHVCSRNQDPYVNEIYPAQETFDLKQCGSITPNSDVTLFYDPNLPEDVLTAISALSMLKPHHRYASF